VPFSRMTVTCMSSELEVGWSSVPNWVIRSNRLQGTEKWVYIALLNRANAQGQCFPSIETLCNDVNVSRNTIIRTIKSLEAKGLVSKQRRRDENNLYQIHTWKGSAKSELTDSGGSAIQILSKVHSEYEGSAIQILEEDTYKNTHYGENVESDALDEGTKQAKDFPNEFYITDEMKSWALRKVPGLDLVAETKEFVAYWRHGEGKGKKKKNWVMAWQNRMKQKHAWLPAPEKQVRKVKRF
jgi:predicted transcriptional regulator